MLGKYLCRSLEIALRIPHGKLVEIMLSKILGMPLEQSLGKPLEVELFNEHGPAEGLNEGTSDGHTEEAIVSNLLAAALGHNDGNPLGASLDVKL